MTEAKSFLVIGADSLIGNEVFKAFENAGKTVYGTSHRPNAHNGFLYLDLGDAPDTWRFPQNVTSAVICAAVTSLERCQRESEASTQINVSAPIAIARRLRGQGANVLFLSSNQVFDGATPFPGPQDPVSPVCAYGRQKAAAEKGILALGEGVSVLRLTKVFHSEMALFSGWMEALKKGRPITAFEDMACAPLPLSLVTDTIVSMMRDCPLGLFHLSGGRDVTYVDIARHLARRLGVAEDLVRPVSWRDAGQDVAEPPVSSALDMNGMEGVDPFVVIDEVFFPASGDRS